jgi:UDP-glucose 4-epimerase
MPNGPANAGADKPRRICVTGGGGFIGSHITEALLRRGDEVVVVDTASATAEAWLAPYRGDPRLRVLHGSVTDEALLRTALQGCDTVFHLAAVVGVGQVMRNQIRVIDVNVIGTNHLLKICTDRGIRVLLASTSEVFGKSPQSPFKEDESDSVFSAIGPNNRWIYAASKMIGEYMGHAYAQQGLQFSAVRYFNVYGPRQDVANRARVLSHFLWQALHHEPLTVHGTGAQSRCFCYIDDAVEGTIRAAEAEAALGQAFNIGRPEELSVMGLAQLVREVVPHPVEITQINPEEVLGKKHEDIEKRVPDISKAERLLGFRAETDLRTGLARTWEWYEANAEVIRRLCGS